MLQGWALLKKWEILLVLPLTFALKGPQALNHTTIHTHTRTHSPAPTLISIVSGCYQACSALSVSVILSEVVLLLFLFVRVHSARGLRTRQCVSLQVTLSFGSAGVRLVGAGCVARSVAPSCLALQVGCVTLETTSPCRLCQ